LGSMLLPIHSYPENSHVIHTARGAATALGMLVQLREAD
jgi:hypothetical protein